MGPPPQAHDAAPTPLTGTLNALKHRGRSGRRRIPATPALCHCLRIISRHCSTNPPCAAILSTVQELCGKAGVNSVTLCRPLPYSLHVAPVERGRRNPRNRYRRLPYACAGQCCDIRPVERVSSVTFGPVQPSPSLCYHPGHCSTIPGAVGTRDDKTSPRPLLCTLWPSVSCTLESAYRR
jgi:hypothetical protein